MLKLQNCSVSAQTCAVNTQTSRAKHYCTKFAKLKTQFALCNSRCKSYRNKTKICNVTVAERMKVFYLSQLYHEAAQEATVMDFFHTLYGQAPPGQLTLWVKQTKQTFWFGADELKQAAQTAINLATDNDVYFGLGLREKRLAPGKRGSVEDVVALPAMWLDVDLADPAHKQTNLPPDVATAKAILARFPLQYSILVHSGHGLYPLWLFSKPRAFKNSQEREQAKALAGKFNAVMANFFKKAGYHLDNTSDLARVIRVPGTVNRKREPVPVRLLESYPKRRYSFKELNLVIEKLYSELPAPPGEQKTSTPADYPPASAELILNRCAFMRHCRDDATSLPEPDWYYGVVSVLSRTEEVDEVIHAVSSAYPGYTVEETNEKIAHALKTGPTTCGVIQEKCGDSYCRECRFNGKITSPVLLGTIAASTEAIPTQPFPLEALPDCFRRYSEEAAFAVGCPVDYVAVFLLALAGGTIGATRRISLKKDWTEGAGLYNAVVGSPAAKKSPALEKAGRFVYELANKLRESHHATLADFSEELSAYEVNLQHWKQEVKKAAGGNAETPGGKPAEPEEPPMRRLYTADATVEALAELIEQNPRGIMLIRDELTAWVKSLNQYKSGRGADRQFFLSCWSNAPAPVDRKGKKPIFLPRPFLSVCGCIPPDVLNDLLDEENRADGFVDRILFSYPESVDQSWTDAEISDEATRTVRQCFEKLSELAFDEDGEPVLLALDSVARATFVRWYNTHYAELNLPEFPEALQGPWGKMPGQCTRLILIIHCVHQATEGAGKLVDEQSVLAGIVLADYFKNHCKKVWGELAKTHSEKQIDKLLAWLHKHGKQETTAREIQRYKVAGCKTTEAAKDMLNKLKEAGYGLWADKKNIFLLV